VHLARIIACDAWKDIESVRVVRNAHSNSPRDLPMCYCAMPPCKRLHCVSRMDPSITIVRSAFIPVPTVVPYQSRNHVITRRRDHNRNPSQRRRRRRLLPKGRVITMAKRRMTTNPLPRYPQVRNVSSPRLPHIATALPRVP